MKIREVYLKETKSYANHTPAPKDNVLDCSLGVNPYGPPVEALEAMKAYDVSHLGDYAHSHAAHEAIVKYWSKQAKLSVENVLLSDGSVSAIYLINALFANPGAKVVGFFPAFTDFIVNAEMNGMKYIGVAPASADFKESADDLIAAITEDVSLVYIDNPNNPTGQVMPKADVIRVLEHAQKLDVAVLVDEAYGDFISREESILSEFERFENLLVLRTYSKGFGLAGLRAGYVIARPDLIRYMGKTSNPYAMNEFARVAAVAAMSVEGYTDSHGPDNAAVKQQIRENVGHNLTLLCTDDRVPICSLQHKDNVDLQALLYEDGILTVSGEEFDAMDQRCVRLRVPRKEAADRLVAAIRKIDLA